MRTSLGLRATVLALAVLATTCTTVPPAHGTGIYHVGVAGGG